jgi:hypothetical protein
MLACAPCRIQRNRPRWRACTRGCSHTQCLHRAHNRQRRRPRRSRSEGQKRIVTGPEATGRQHHCTSPSVTPIQWRGTRSGPSPNYRFAPVPPAAGPSSRNQSGDLRGDRADRPGPRTSWQSASSPCFRRLHPALARHPVAVCDELPCVRSANPVDRRAEHLRQVLSSAPADTSRARRFHPPR